MRKSRKPSRKLSRRKSRRKSRKPSRRKSRRKSRKPSRRKSRRKSRKKSKKKKSKRKISMVPKRKPDDANEQPPRRVSTRTTGRKLIPVAQTNSIGTAQIHYSNVDKDSEIDRLIENILEIFESSNIVKVSMIYGGQGIKYTADIMGHTYILVKNDETSELWVVDVTKKFGDTPGHLNYIRVNNTVAEKLGDYKVKYQKPPSKKVVGECTGPGGGFGWCSRYIELVENQIMDGNFDFRTK